MSETIIKSKARWINGKKFFCQLVISIKSYIAYPFVKKIDGAAKDFFSKIYYGTKTDEFIFDSNDELYLEKSIRPFSLLSELCSNHIDIIYDCGCGNGCLLKMLNKRHLSFKSYIGIDYAHEATSLYENAKIVNDNFCDYNFCIDPDTTKLFVFSNTLCYISNNELDKLLKNVSQMNTFLMIIDPVPGLFWDATFDNIKLYYRSNKHMNKILKNYNFECLITSIDYLKQKGDYFFIPMSYCSLFYRKMKD